MLKCVIFDMDGTIGDTLPLCLAAFRRAIAETDGRSFTDEEIYACFGPSEEGTIALLLGGDNPECCRLYQQYNREMHAELCPRPFEGVPELLSSLRAAGLQLAMVTGKGPISLATTLQQFGMEQTFDAVETGKPEGPDKPAGIRRVLAKLGLRPEEAVYVGDSPSDVDSAREAGVQAISAAWADGSDPQAQQAKNPLLVCRSIAELQAYLLKDEALNPRYARQVAMASIGADGQRKLSRSKVLVVGAGGLGSPVLMYLCAAGVGHLGIADFDKVSESNLNRQILHSEIGIGVAKTTSAKARLLALNPGAEITEHNTMLTEENIDGIISAYDLVVDCVDNIAARVLVAKACCRLGKPVAEAGIESFSGFVMSYTPGHACYCCLHGEQPRERAGSIPVLGATAGATGSIQAAEAIKLLLDIGEPLLNCALYFNLLYHDYDIIEVQPNPDCPVCGSPKRA